MMTELKLREKVKEMFLSYPEPKGLLGIYPEGPLTIVDDPMGK